VSIETKSSELQVEHFQPIENSDYVAGIDYYLDDAEREQILRPNQSLIFNDIKSFLSEGGKRGYVTSATGTGKTVVFVELSKAFKEAGRTAGRTPRILVVEPTRDLVHQTLGRSGEKGYGQFATDLKVASYFSDSTNADKAKMNEADVVVTTYDSYSLMARRKEYRDQSQVEKDLQINTTLAGLISKNADIRTGLYNQLEELDTVMQQVGRVATGRNILDSFDVFIFDEGHHLLGDRAATSIDDIDKNKVIIAFTATPDANEKKRLDAVLPVKIHDLGFKEAIDMELSAPVASIGIRSKSKITGTNIFDSEGDYNEGSLSYLALSNNRNQLIVNIAKILVEHGFATLIPCIPGQGAFQARLIADKLNEEGVRTEAIYGEVPTRRRNNIYKAFEKGEIDVLTNIRILGEGWDSPRTKAIIEASPTRSLIVKMQRIGRIVRPGDIAVVVDLLDEYDRLNPPLHLSDITGGEDLKIGQIFGEATEAQTERIASLIQALGQSAVIADKTPADYSKLFDTLAEYQSIVSGKMSTNRKGQHAVAEKMNPAYAGLNDEILTRLWQDKGIEPDIVLGRQNFNIRMLYNTGESTQLLREIPVCDKDKAYVEKDDRWLSVEGFVIGFKNKYPNLTEAMVEERLRELGESVQWRPLKQFVPRQNRLSITEYIVYKAYKADKQTISVLGKQIGNYYDIVSSINS
jgi:superfamily II DNA or RNA helicase